MLKIIHKLTLRKRFMIKILDFKLNFAKGYAPNQSEEVFVIKKVKNTLPWAYVIN